MPSSNGNIFRVTGPLLGEFTVYPWIPLTKGRTWNFDIFFDLHLNEWLNKRSRSRWFEIHRAHYDVTAMISFKCLMWDDTKITSICCWTNSWIAGDIRRRGSHMMSLYCKIHWDELLGVSLTINQNWLISIINCVSQQINSDQHTPMMTSSNENIFRVTGLLCGEFTGHHYKSPLGR